MPFFFKKVNGALDSSLYLSSFLIVIRYYISGWGNFIHGWWVDKEMFTLRD